MNELKSRIQNGQKTRAVWLEAGSPAMAEAAVYAGARFLIIDDEHGPASTETTAHIARAIEAAGGHPMVRVAANNPVLLKRVLEIGLRTIMIPLVNTASEAQAAVAACRYPPGGKRGYAGDIRASRYGSDPSYPTQANDDLFLMMQIESAEGVKNAEEIAAVDGVDMLFIGPYDMSGDYGPVGATDNPKVRAAIASVEEIANAVGKPLGTVPSTGITVRDLLDGSYHLAISGSEIGMAMSAISTDLEKDDTDWL